MRALVVLVCCMFGTISAFFPDRAGAFDMVYTVQAGCYPDMGEARQHYYTLENNLDKLKLDLLRIEEIGQSFCVRIGKFRESGEAEKFLQSVKPLIASSVVMQAYILNERVKKMFFYPKSLDKETSASSAGQAGQSRESAAAGGDGRPLKSVHEERGDRYLDEKRQFSAAEEYRLALLDDPDNAELTWKLAELYYELQMPDDSFKAMQRAIGLSPGTSEKWRTRLGKLYYQYGRFEEAAEQFAMVLEMDPGAPDLNYYLGKIYLARNELDKAREQFLEALTLNPGSAAVYYDLGKTFFLKNNLLMAWSAALTAQKLGYDNEDLINELSKISKKPDLSWDSSGKDIIIREIIVQSRDHAEDIVFRLSQGERFENVVNDELDEQAHTVQYRELSDLDPKVAAVSQKQGVFATPVIVETHLGFHVVQRIPSIACYLQQ